MKKCLWLLCAWFVCLGSLYAQSRTIKGKVLDGKNDPLAGISVTAKGTAQGTTTSETGDFSLAVPDSIHALIFSSVNYATQEVKIDGSSMLTIKLIPTTGALSEVVVVAYGKERKTNITGSIATVSASYLENKPFSSVDKALQGAVPGLQSVSSSGVPGSGTDIRIRGIGSINASPSPLWVIDGVIATTGDISDNANQNVASATALSSLNPDDIESISVLKDAAATSVYGSRAANGVIIVTTKKGKEGKTTLSASGEAGIANRAFHFINNRPMTTAENKLVIREALQNAGVATSDAEADSLSAVYFHFNDNVNTNWLDVVSQQSTQQQYNVSLSGGNDKTQFYASGGYFNQEGTTLATGFKRINGSLSVTHKANSRATFTAGINGSNSQQKAPPGEGRFDNPIYAVYNQLPWFSPYNADGSPRYGDTTEFAGVPSSGFNPIPLTKLDRDLDNEIALRGYSTGEYKIINNLVFTTRYSAELLIAQSDQYHSPLYGYGALFSGYGFSANRRIFDWTWTNLLNYRFNLTPAKDVYVNAQLGQEAQKTSNFFQRMLATGYPTNPALSYLASATSPTTTYALPSESSTTSYFASANANYKDRYVVSGSFRRDGSSVFGANHKWGNFYSAGLSWNLNEEAFLKDSKVISLLKLRSSYGENGNALGFDYYASLATYTYDVSYSGVPGSRLNNIGNPNLTWEKNKAFNVGLDFGLFNNRLGGTVEYYNRKTDGLLANIQLSRTSGFSSQLQNIGALSNKGIEISLNARPVNSKNFIWDVAFNISHNKNRVTELYGGRSVASLFYNYTVGYDLQTYYLPQWAGVDPANGNPLWYTDSTRKTTTSNYNEAQYQLKYSAAPTFYGALTNTFTYKGLSLDVQFNYNVGNYIMDGYSYLESDGAYIGVNNQMSSQLLSWKKEGDKTDVPKIIYGGNNNSFYRSTRYLHKDDYVRLRNVQLAYNLPKAWLTKAHIANLSVYVRGTNLATFVKDKNLPVDPEQGINNYTDQQVFIPKLLTAGIKVGL